MDCLLSIALVIGENVCEIKRQNMKHGGRGHDQRKDERGSVLQQCWGEPRSTRTNRKQVVDVRQVQDGEMLEVEKKTKRLPKWTPPLLLFFRFLSVPHSSHFF